MACIVYRGGADFIKPFPLLIRKWVLVPRPGLLTGCPLWPQRLVPGRKV